MGLDGEKTVKTPTIVLKRLHFDMLLGVIWLKEAKAKIQVVDGVIEVIGERLISKSWPEPVFFTVEDDI